MFVFLQIPVVSTMVKQKLHKAPYEYNSELVFEAKEIW
jgi:hypothetical protein